MVDTAALDGAKVLADVDTMLVLPRVSRVEIIDSDGRAFVGYYDTVGVSLSVQDDQGTLKIFAGEKRHV